MSRGRSAPGSRARLGSRTRLASRTGSTSRTGSARRTGARPRRSLTARAAVLGIALCAVVVSLAYPLQRYLAQRGAIAATRAATRAEQQAIASLTGQLRRWHDPAYVEQQARVRLLYTTPGTANYVVLGATQPATRTRGRATVPADPSTSWYARLWASDVAAGHRPTPGQPTGTAR